MNRRNIITAAISGGVIGAFESLGIPMGVVSPVQSGIAGLPLCEERPVHGLSLADVLRSSMQCQPIKYFGSGTSHFQSEPLQRSKDNRILDPVSDWEYELQKNLSGKTSHIHPRQSETELPQFLKKSELYIQRSAELGNNMFRLSIDFARLCPGRDVFNTDLMREYVKTFALIRLKGQEPMVTLSHFTMPLDLVSLDSNGEIKKGGWEHAEVITRFRFFLSKVIDYLSNKESVRAALADSSFAPAFIDKMADEGLVQYFMSFNEPAIPSLNGYLTGVFPPYKRGSLLGAKKILDTILQAHEIARDLVKGLARFVPKNRQPQFGAGYNWQYYDGGLGGLMSKLDKFYTDRFEKNRLDGDFMGLHYYFRQTTPFFTRHWSEREYSDMPSFGDIYPKGILDVLRKMHQDYPATPIFVSEIGFADAEDRRRPFWILETLRFISLAVQEGIPITGVLLWSLVNNFEWDLGMGPKFGLFAENELNKQLEPSKEGIRSWEVWKIATQAIRAKDEQSLRTLELAASRATSQHSQASR